MLVLFTKVFFYFMLIELFISAKLTLFKFEDKLMLF
jgi:hypothetical protein